MEKLFGLSKDICSTMIRWLVPVMLLTGLITGIGVCDQPIIKAVTAETAPVIDGDISDACWKQAPSTSDFYFPENDVQADEHTTAWLCYDQKNIYLAFSCTDSQPDKIMAEQKKRGGDIGKDDWVGFDLDCYGDYNHVVWFDVSAGGVQVENIGSDVSKIEWRGDWNAASKRQSDGYTVEIAVPFSILRYNENQTSMGIAFIRRHARINQWWWSPKVGVNKDARNFYKWDGLKLPSPNVKPLLMGYALYGTGEDNNSKRMGLDIKHEINPNLTAVMTLNPDFRNVEQQVESIDFSYTERYLDDSRPFFQDAKDFYPASDIFYTRRIEDIAIGSKVYGKFDHFDIGLMNMIGQDHENHTALRAYGEWNNRTWLNVQGVQSNVDGKGYLSSRISAWHRLYDRNERKLEIYGRTVAADNISGIGKGSENGWSISSYGRPRMLQWELGGWNSDSDFQPYLGYNPEVGVNAKYLDFWINDSLTTGKLKDWNASLDITHVEHTDGSLYHEYAGIGGGLNWRNGTGCWIRFERCPWPPNVDRAIRGGYSWGNNKLYGNGGVSLGIGRIAGGPYMTYSASQRFKMTQKLSISLTYGHSQIGQPSPDAYSSNQLIVTPNYEIDPERTILGRIVSQEGKTNCYLTFRQRVRSGTDVYLIFGDPNSDSTRSSFTLKLIRPI